MEGLEPALSVNSGSAGSMACFLALGKEGREWWAYGGRGGKWEEVASSLSSSDLPEQGLA